MPGYEIDSVIAQLRINPTIAFVNPTFQADSSVFFVYDHLLVAFNPDVQLDSIQALVGQLFLTVALEPSEHHRSWMLRVTAESPPDIFDVGNLLFESGACYYSHPNFAGSGFVNRHWTPNDEYFWRQWHLEHTEAVYGIPGVDIDMLTPGSTHEGTRIS